MTELEQRLLIELEREREERESEREAFEKALSLILTQQKQIIELLKRPPSGDGLQKALEQALESFSRKLSSGLKASNEQLIEELKRLL